MKINRNAIITIENCILREKYKNNEGQINHFKVLKQIKKVIKKKNFEFVSYEPSSG